MIALTELATLDSPRRRTLLHIEVLSSMISSANFN